MPTKPARTPARKPASRRQEARWQREKRLQRITIGVAAVALLVVLAIPAYAYYDEYVKPWREPVIKVGSTSFNMRSYVNMLRYEKAEKEMLGQTFDSSIDPFSALDDMKNFELVRQAAPGKNIEATQEEITTYIRGIVLGTLGNQAETMSEADKDAKFKELYPQHLKDRRISKKNYERLIGNVLMYQEMREIVGKDVPTVAEQVHLLVMRVDSEENVTKATDRLNAGEDFAAVAKDLSADTQQGSEPETDAGWMPRGVMPTEVDDFAFASEPGATSGAISTKNGLYIVRVLEREQAREVEADDRETLKDNALDNWLVEESKRVNPKYYWNSGKYQWALDHL